MTPSKISQFLLSKRHLPFYSRLLADLRTDHAGEYGAVRIYDGILWSLRLAPTQPLRDFAHAHRNAERIHLATMRELVPHAHRTRLIPLWHIAGWVLGALPNLVGGPPAVYRTIHHVEEFVDKHYQEQIDGIDAYRRNMVVSVDTEECESLDDLRDILERYRLDEVHHRDDAGRRVDQALKSDRSSWWTWVVQAGSTAAVKASRIL
ncbi:ubiquinone biosynthesis protein Coq7 [Cladochytrium replicatum]|nr:ubiquinone biosynthesis protein Coq7 [Cladochytrium replicatum]